MKTILCYGDSNTWGYVPGSLDFKTVYVERYPRTIRWPGLLQQYLGSEYYVVEEGLNGRTTDTEQKIFREKMEGLIWFHVCFLMRHWI